MTRHNVPCPDCRKLIDETDTTINGKDYVITTTHLCRSIIVTAKDHATNKPITR